MDRKSTTKFLSQLLIDKKLTGIGKYWASEVTLDYGKKSPKRVDFMQFVPRNQFCVSAIEQGEFICYEIKSCKEDFRSGNGLNFEGDRNYVVMTMETYKDLVDSEIKKLSRNVGVMVAVPVGSDKAAELENPTELSEDTACELVVIKPAYRADRRRSVTELLFCMLRSGK